MGTEAKHVHGQLYGASIYSESEMNDLLLESEREREFPTERVLNFP